MLEKTILSNLVFNGDYFQKVFPYLKTDYFEDNNLRKVFETYSKYVEQYKEPPSVEALKISIDKRKDLNEDSYKTIMSEVDSLKLDGLTNPEWLVSETEKFCQDRDLFNSIRKAILIMDGQDKDNDKGSIPELLSKSLAISFDTHIGHDFIDDADSRYDFYHRKEERMAERIDANMMNVTLDELKIMPRDVYQKRIDRIKGKSTGRLVIKEYPTGSAHAGHFRHLLHELKMKRGFTPDVIFVDYLNICSSSRVKGSAAANSYTLVKSIAEEIRGLSMEFNCAIVTSSQFNRDGYGNSDVDLTNTSESMGITHTADCILGLISSEDLDALGQIMIKQLKNRWGDLGYYRRFTVGIDRAKMQIFDLEESAQRNVMNDKVVANTAMDDSDNPIFDNTAFGKSKKTLFSAGGLV